MSYPEANILFFSPGRISRNIIIQLSLMLGIFYLGSCTNKKKELFTNLEANQTGISFSNKLTATANLNMFKYMYFYNGAGVGAGDFNNDGLVDLFFASNQSQNSLYINKGKLLFSDVTANAGIPLDSSWSTGVSVVDINNDGKLDIYVCRVGNFESLQSQNQLLINKGVDKDGIPHFENQAREWGVNFSGFSTQAAFLDYDLDGDLDMYLLNHSLRFNGTFAKRETYINTYDSLSGDRFYRNDGDRFTDITKSVGINSSIIGYGLGVAVSDINLDGYPDLYIGNDFHENDYLYINQKNGTFKDTMTSAIMHTSQFSMGVDVADVNNDAWPEIISMDMLPYDPYILKRSLGEDAYDIFNFKIRHGYNYQYARNNLQYNRKNGVFSETGLYAGISATDWSWAPLWIDFDNDGKKDLFVSNGIPKRLNDIDYVNFASNEELQHKIRNNQLDNKDLALVEKFPEIKLPNKFFLNKGELQFRDFSDSIGNNRNSFSNGAAYADLDNDGDIDIVVNNIGDEVMLYRNNSELNGNKSFRINLTGPSKNINAVGARVIVYSGHEIITYEKYPVKGFQSSMETSTLIGVGNMPIDSAFLLWPDNTVQKIDFDQGMSVDAKYQPGLPQFDFSSYRTGTTINRTRPMQDFTASTGLNYYHTENSFIEFDRETLIPHMVSREGPALAVADINRDELEDVFIGSSKLGKPAVFLQLPNGKFSKVNQPQLDMDSMFEEVDANWVDVNNDGNIDLLLASGGNEYYGEDERLLPRVFLNDGKGNLTKVKEAFKGLYQTHSCIIPYDFTGDGYTDLFIGGRAVPWEYGETPRSYLLENDKTGRFTDVTNKYSAELAKIGFVTNALWIDYDKDNDKDLVLTLEWGGILAFVNENGKFTKQVISEKLGWWNFIIPCDIDLDGDIDWVAGNLGLNSRLKATDKEPVRLYYYDFDGNGKKDQILTYYLDGKEIPFANKEELQKQLPVLKKQFLYAEDFAKASLAELFDGEKLKNARVLTANYFQNSLIINEGNGKFRMESLPWEAQLTPYKAATVVEANSDSLPDILLMGNFYAGNIQMGRYDADFGTVLTNSNKNGFSYNVMNGLKISGEVRKISSIKIKGVTHYILAKNNASLQVIGFK